jgi:hypothetical protein
LHSLVQAFISASLSSCRNDLLSCCCRRHGPNHYFLLLSPGDATATKGRHQYTVRLKFSCYIRLSEKIKADRDTALVPVILVTALSDKQDSVAGIQAGADHIALYLAIPPHPRFISDENAATSAMDEHPETMHVSIFEKQPVCRIYVNSIRPMSLEEANREGFHELSGGQRITFHYKSDLKSGPVVLDRAQAPARERVGPRVRDLAPPPEE